MANGTWNNATEDDDWANAGNWTGGVPGASNTATFDGSEAARGLPSVNLPNLDVVALFLKFSADYSTVEAGSLSSTGLANSSVFVDNGKVVLDETCSSAHATNGTLTLKAGVEFDNNVVLYDGGIVTPAGAGVTIDGEVRAYASGGTLDWGGGNLTVRGSVDASGLDLTHINSTGATLYCDYAGEVDMGGDATGLTVSTAGLSGTIFCTRDAAVYALNTSAGTFNGGGQTWAIGDGGYTRSGTTTLTGTFTVNLSAGAGAYTQTAGTIAADAVLNVTTGSGGFTYTALTQTGTINITAAATSTTAKWGVTPGSCLNNLTINSGVTLTQSGNLGLIKLSGSGTLAGAWITYWRPVAATDWAHTGTMSGTGAFSPFPATIPLVINAAVNTGTRPVSMTGVGSHDLTLSGLSCTALTVYSGTADGTHILRILGNSSGTSITLGTSTNKYGVLTFGSGFVHRWTGAIAYGGTGTANALNLQGHCIFTGTFTGTGIVVTPTYEGQIDCGGFGRVTAVTSTGRRLIVRRAKDASGNPVRAWNGDGSTNVMYKGRKVIGEPGIN